MGWQILAEWFPEHEVTFSCWCEAINGRSKKIKRFLAFSCSTCWIRETEEQTNATRKMVLAFVEDPVGYKIELIDRDLWKS